MTSYIKTYQQYSRLYRNIQHLLGRIQRSKSACYCTSSNLVEPTETVATISPELDDALFESERLPFKMPKKLKKDPYMVLKVLSSQVGYDPTAYDYYLQDDFHLSSIQRNRNIQYLTVQENGRKVAKQFIREHPECFQQEFSEPPIKVFTPPTEKSFTHKNISVPALEERILKKNITEAKVMFEELRVNGTEIPQETLLDFWDLICIHNGENPDPDSLWVDNRLMIQSRKSASQWKNENNLVFDDMVEKPYRAHRSYLLGLSKYNGSMETIWQEFRTLIEFAEKDQIKVDLQVYNAVLQALTRVPLGKDPFLSALKILYNMKKEGIKPDINTLNAALELSPPQEEAIEKIVNEMRILSIEPDAKTWSLILKKIPMKGKLKSVSKAELLDFVLRTFERKFPEVAKMGDNGALVVQFFKLCINSQNGFEFGQKYYNLLLKGFFPPVMHHEHENIMMTILVNLSTLYGTIQDTVDLITHCNAKAMRIPMKVFSLFVQQIVDEKAFSVIQNVVGGLFLNLPPYNRKALLKLMASQKQNESIQKEYVELSGKLIRKELMGENKRFGWTTSPLSVEELCSIIYIFINGSEESTTWNAFLLLANKPSRETESIGEENMAAVKELFSYLLGKEQFDKADAVYHWIGLNDPDFLNACDTLIEESGIGRSQIPATSNKYNIKHLEQFHHKKTSHKHLDIKQEKRRLKEKELEIEY